MKTRCKQLNEPLLNCTWDLSEKLWFYCTFPSPGPPLQGPYRGGGHRGGAGYLRASLWRALSRAPGVRACPSTGILALAILGSPSMAILAWHQSMASWHEFLAWHPSMASEEFQGITKNDYEVLGILLNIMN